MEYFAATDIGNYRKNNEDFFYAEDSLFMVADGMGGHSAGEVASKMTVETFAKNFYQKLKSDLKPKKELPASKKRANLDPGYIKQTLISSLDVANTKVYKLSSSKIEYTGMGTTFTSIFIYNNTAYIVHVGDSRAYIKRSDDFRLLTNDHTIVGELYRSGKITYEETFNHPQRNFLTNVVGVSRDLTCDFLKFELKSGDILLLCSDGLNSMLRDSLILKIINKFEKTESIAKNLIKYANKKGGLDNTTVIVVKI